MDDYRTDYRMALVRKAVVGLALVTAFIGVFFLGVMGAFSRGPAVVVQTAPVVSPADAARLEKEAHQRAAAAGITGGAVESWHAWRARQRQKREEAATQ